MSRLFSSARGDHTQAEAAARTGLTQTKVSRLERGDATLTPDEVDDYTRALNTPPAIRDRLRELAEIRTATQIASRTVLSRSAAAIQQRIERLEHDANVIRSWQPELVIGPLQTEEYTAAMHGGDVDPDWLAARAARRAVFADPSRTWHQIMSEGALRWTLGSPGLMIRQLEHLIQLSRRPNVRLGIVDARTPKPFAAPAAFHLLGDTAMVATAVGTSFVTNASDLAAFADQFAALESVAHHDAAARDLLIHFINDYR